MQPIPQAQTEQKSQYLPILLAGALLLCLADVTWAMTSLTHNLDDIKQTIFLITGPLLMLAGLGLILGGLVPAPPKWVALGGLGYLLVMTISTLASTYRWAGWTQILLLWSAGGFFVAAMVITSRPRSAAVLLRGLTAILLLTNLIGFFMYDFTGLPAHPGGLTWVFKLLYPGNENHTGALFNLLSTLTCEEARSVMQSTILNRDFYGAFCLLLLPFAMLSALMPAPSPSLLDRLINLFWRLVGILTTLTAIQSIFYCHNYLINLINCLVIGLMLLGAFFVLWHSGINARLWPAILGVLILILGTCSAARFIPPAAKAEMTQLPGKMRILWGGAWGIFKDHPLLGGGPGTYILQPAHRSPDYYLHQISNVATFSHNYFLDLLAETGLAGFACFTILLLALLLPVLRRTFRDIDPAYRLACLAASASLLSSILFGLFNPVTRWIIGAAPLWTIMGLTAGLLVQTQTAARLESTAEPNAEDHTIASMPSHSAWTPWILRALAMLGLILLPLSFISAQRYFSAAQKYALGLISMEYGYQPYDQTRDTKQDQSQIIQYLNDGASLFEECLRLDPTNLSAYYKLGSIDNTLSQIENSRAEEFQKQGHLLEAGQSQARADQYLEQGKKVYEQLATLAPDYAEIHYNFGIVYQQYADMLERKFKQEPTQTKLHEQAAQYKALALTHLARMLQMSNKKEVAILYSQQCQNMGRNDLALAALKQASDRDPTDAQLALQYYKAATAAHDETSARAARERLEQIQQKDATPKPR